MSNTYNHTIKVFDDLPAPSAGYQNPVHCELTEGQLSDVTTALQFNARPAGRVYEIEHDLSALSNVLRINDPQVLSIFVGENVDTIGFENCANLKYLEFADPASIEVLDTYCFKTTTNASSPELIIDFNSFTNLKKIGMSFLGRTTKFTNNRVVLPSSIEDIGRGIFNYTHNGYSYTFVPIDEFEFKPVNLLSAHDGYIFRNSNGAAGTGPKLSSITLNDVAMKFFLNKSLNGFGYSNNNNTIPYRKMYLETLSNLHELSVIKKNFLRPSQHEANAGDIFTFSNFQLSDLEDQESHVFDEYLDLLPNEAFVTTGLKGTVNFANLSVWVPTALYDTWCQEWPNYSYLLLPYNLTHTILKFQDGSSLTINKSGMITQQDMIDAGLFDGTEGIWIKSPTRAIIGKGVSAIGGGIISPVFEFCSTLSSVLIPDTVTQILDSSFKDCIRLNSVAIPSSVILLEEHAFDGCRAITSFSVDANNPNYTEVNGMILSKDGTTLVKGKNGNDVIVPNTVTYIRNGAFDGFTKLLSVTIPDSVEEIGDWAFSDTTISVINIPNSVSALGGHAFCGCHNLSSIVIPDSVTTVGNHVFDYCSKLSFVTIGTGLSNISEHMFYNCDGLSSITIPNWVSSIGAYAFGECNNLSTITIPSSVSRVEYAAFSDCPAMTNVVIERNNISSLLFLGQKLFENTGTTSALLKYTGNDVPVGSEVRWNVEPSNTGYSITNLGRESVLTWNGTGENTGAAVIRCTFEPDVHTVFTYGDGTQQEIRNAGTLNRDALVRNGIRASETAGISRDGNTQPWIKMPVSVKIGTEVTGIGIYTFQDCDGLTQITIPDSVTSIGWWAFYGCHSLYSVRLPQFLTNIDVGTFSDCTVLANITIPNSVTHIGQRAFKWCGITNPLVIPDGVTNIDSEAFIGCQYIPSITVGSGVSNIGSGAFSGCIGVSAITFKSETAPTVTLDTFGNGNISMGFNGRTLGINEVHVPFFTNDYKTGVWSDVLCNSSVCNFDMYRDVVTRSIPAWNACTKSTNWNNPSGYGPMAQIRYMNNLSPYITVNDPNDPKISFVDRTQFAINRGCNYVAYFVSNHLDDSGASGSMLECHGPDGKEGYSPYGSNYGFTNMVIAPEAADIITDRLRYTNDRGLGIVLFLMADDSDGWASYLTNDLSRWRKYCKDLKKLGWFSVASTVVVGLEIEEYWDNDNLVNNMIDILRNYYSGVIGVHHCSNEYRIGETKTDVSFVQLNPEQSIETIKQYVQTVKAALNKPVCMFELERYPNQTKSQAALDAGAYSVGNW